MTRRKRLSEDDLELWRQVARTAEPLHPAKKARQVQPAPKPRKTPVSETKPEPIPAFRIGTKAPHTPPGHDLQRPLGQRLAGQPVAMDRKNFTRMKRGKLQPEGRIDLHGMTLAQAHPALTGFILQSHAMGRRLVLVITGKGKRGDEDGPIPRQKGVLRHQVPQWLRMAPLHGIVLQISEAHLKHGGGGAYYVYLRRSRG